MIGLGTVLRILEDFVQHNDVGMIHGLGKKTSGTSALLVLLPVMMRHNLDVLRVAYVAPICM